MTAPRRTVAGTLGVLAAAMLGACDAGGRPPTQYSDRQPPAAGRVTVPYVMTSGFQAGPRAEFQRVRNPYEGATREGEQYYTAFNCGGCHGGLGGGGIGPPFLVRDFIYGSDPGNIFQSIVQGRPHGMPAYGGKAPDEVIWKIVAYVQSLAEPYLRDAPERDEHGADGRDREHGEEGG
jgi:cytochrome c oxidase cbb3-type subunit III